VQLQAAMAGDEPYELGTDSLPHPGTPRGSVTVYRLDDSARFPERSAGTGCTSPPSTRRITRRTSSCSKTATGTCSRMSTLTWSSTISSIEPRCLSASVCSSSLATAPGNPLWGGDTNRNVEYDTLSDAYAQFLLEELIPGLPVAVTDDATRRALCGHSSGGICAFTAAWEHPEAFGNVVSHCGSFVNIRGGHEYPSVIRRTERKPLRVFLQTGERDLDVVFGNWQIGNRDMASALAYRGYEYELVIGEGGHTLEHGGAIFPDTMRWLWRRSDDPRSP
jgi:Putative esterase